MKDRHKIAKAPAQPDVASGPVGPKEWLLEQVRVTAFRYPGVDMDPEIQWKTFAATAPEQIQVKPGIKSARFEAPYGPGRLILSVDPQRIDWTLVPVASEEAPDFFPVLGNASESATAFVKAAGGWLSSEVCQRLVRFAYGCVLLHAFKQRIEAYQLLARKLPAINLDVDNSGDFLYQINRLTTSRLIDGLRVNRLSKWAAIRLIMGVMAPAGPGVPMRYPPVADVYATRLELDISSDADRNEDLPRKTLGELLLELIEHANRIAINGDVR